MDSIPFHLKANGIVNAKRCDAMYQAFPVHVHCYRLDAYAAHPASLRVSLTLCHHSIVGTKQEIKEEALFTVLANIFYSTR